MKKICLSLLLTINVISVSCMEKERPQSNTLTMQHLYQTDHQNPAQPIYCEANQPGWQQLDKIAHMTYHNNQSATMDEVELTPLYKTATELQEKTSLLQTNSMQPNTDLMKKLHQDATEYFYNKDDKKLLCIINDMDSAKKNGINEDMMIRFAMKEMPYFTMSVAPFLTPALFSCLKNYFNAIKTSQEAIPKDHTVFANHNALNNIFNPNDIEESNASLLKKNITSIITERPFSFLKYLYDNSKTTYQISSSEPYDNLKQSFYINASQLFINKRHSGLDLFINLIKKAKELHYIQEEKDFGYDMLTYNASMGIRFSNRMHSPVFPNFSYDHTNYRISFLCFLIGKYNQARAHKATPSTIQYNYYQLHKKLYFIPLPDTFDNRFNEEDYAFEQYGTLIQEHFTLLYATDAEVEQSIHQIYPPRK